MKTPADGKRPRSKKASSIHRAQTTPQEGLNTLEVLAVGNERVQTYRASPTNQAPNVKIVATH